MPVRHPRHETALAGKELRTDFNRETGVGFEHGVVSPAPYLVQ